GGAFPIIAIPDLPESPGEQAPAVAFINGVVTSIQDQKIATLKNTLRMAMLEHTLARLRIAILLELAQIYANKWDATHPWYINNPYLKLESNLMATLTDISAPPKTTSNPDAPYNWNLRPGDPGYNPVAANDAPHSSGEAELYINLEVAPRLIGEL